MKYLIGIIIGILIGVNTPGNSSPPSFRVKSDFRDPVRIECLSGKRFLCRPEIKFGVQQTCF